ncbi:UDP-N-acetylmuramyl-tripeptide synthetase [Candidatus Kaiserbacteria bacterium]|nr:UDP-N-acetylmuramyl-tripeptide synthetase [Candidatus Kaiserbacteria bacterium]
MGSIGTQRSWLEYALRFIEKLIPKKIYRFGQPIYHYLLAILAPIVYRFPSKKITVIVVTGTKGKTTTSELVDAVLKEAGYTTALLNTLRFSIGARTERNMYKMTLRGRFFVQRFLRKAVQAKCTHAIIEMTSEGVRQFRHKYIDLDALIFTNIAREHIESHGSFEKYLAAKLKLKEALEKSSKKDTVIIANTDDPHGKDFLAVSRVTKIPYSLKDISYTQTSRGLSMSYKNIEIDSPLEGKMNVMNILAAVKLAEYLDIAPDVIKRGIERVKIIPGRIEHIEEGQVFDVVVDYAHTPDSLEKFYQTFKEKKKICVLGNTGGGRDKWKRPEMARIAEEYCESVVLTNEDPYDEDPRSIVNEMVKGMKKSPTIIMDRRGAIREALSRAAQAPRNTVVLITGKGTDPYIMEARGKKIPWSDATVVREELRRLNKAR